MKFYCNRHKKKKEVRKKGPKKKKKKRPKKKKKWNVCRGEGAHKKNSEGESITLQNDLYQLGEESFIVRLRPGTFRGGFGNAFSDLL